MIYAAMLLAALFLNRLDKNVILLALLTALTRYLPMNLITDYYLWYSICLLAELFIMVLCIFSSSVVSSPLLLITSLLASSHILNFLYAVPDAYYVTAKYLEYMQMTCFVLVSPPIINYLKRKVKLCLQKYGCGY